MNCINFDTLHQMFSDYFFIASSKFSQSGFLALLRQAYLVRVKRINNFIKIAARHRFAVQPALRKSRTKAIVDVLLYFAVRDQELVVDYFECQIKLLL